MNYSRTPDNDLISRSEMEKRISNMTGMFTDELGFVLSLDAVLGAIENAPAVDAEPVRHGRWLERVEFIAWCEDDADIFVECSECGDTMPGEANYCPNCGCKMDAEVDDENA